MEKVKVISKVSHRVIVKSRDLHFSREWAKKDSVVAIDKEILDELMYDPGFKYMIDTGILYIEDMDVKKDLGIEPIDADEPINIIILSDDEMRQYMTIMTFSLFKEKVRKLGYEQLNSLIDFAISNKYMDYDKCHFLKEISGRDIIQAIRLEAQDKEA